MPPDLEPLLREWRDAREAIFAAEHPPPEAFTRLASAELALMQWCRSMLPWPDA